MLSMRGCRLRETLHVTLAATSGNLIQKRGIYFS